MKGTFATGSIRNYIKPEMALKEMIAAGIERSTAQLALDLAIHACDEANRSFQAVIERSHDPAAAIQAAVIGLQFMEVFAGLQYKGIATLASEAGFPVRQRGKDGTVRDFDGKFE